MQDHHIPDLLRQRATADPLCDAVLDVARQHRLTYRALDRRAEALAAALIDHQVGEGDVIAVLSHNRSAWLELLFACARVGAVLVPLPLHADKRALNVLLRRTAPRLLFFDRAHEALAFSLSRAETGAIGFDDPGEDGYEYLLTVPRPSREIRHHRPADAVWYYAVSASEGAPRLVAQSFAMAWHNALASAQAMEVRAQDRHLMMAPFVQTDGIACFALAHIVSGAQLLFLEDDDLELLLDLLVGAQIDTVRSNAGILSRLDGHDRAGLVDFRMVRWWSIPAPWRDDAVAGRYAQRGVHFHQTRFVPEIGTSLVTPRLEAPDRPGRPSMLVQTRLVDTDDTAVDADASGRLQIRAPALSPGIWEDEGLSALNTTDDGWFDTPWLARYEPTGDLRLVGNRAQLIETAGETVQPDEVERFLEAHPDITDVAVVAIEDARLGKIGRAYVTLRAGARLQAGDLRAYCRERLMAHKIPRDFRFVDAIPRDAAGLVRLDDLT